MIIPSGRADRSAGIHLRKIYKTNRTDTVARASRSDVVSISKFSALVERGRAAALSLPEIRADVVAAAREALLTGGEPSGTELAASMIRAAAEG